MVVLTNVLLLGSIAFFTSYLRPQRCPGCGRQSLLRLIPLFMSEQRSKVTHWCARRGGQYWEKQGVWKIERRRTWWDRAQDQQVEEEVAPWAVGDTDTRAGAPL